jgi:hypothetical protein
MRRLLPQCMHIYVLKIQFTNVPFRRYFFKNVTMSRPIARNNNSRLVDIPGGRIQVRPSTIVMRH